MFNSTTGNNNVAVGLGAGDTATSTNANTTGSNNVWVGMQSGPGVVSASALTNSIAIGYQTLVLASNQAVLGNASITTTILRGAVGIGIDAPTAQIHQVLPTAGTVGQIIKMAATPTADALRITSSADAVLFRVGPGGRPILAVASAPVLGDLVNAETALSVSAGHVIVTSRVSGALKSAILNVTADTKNVALGSNALNGISSGVENTAMGQGSLAQVSTATRNVGIGYNAGTVVTGGSNTFLGAHSGPSTSTATNTVAVGTLSLFSNTTGGGNVAVGMGSGYTETAANANTTGTNNTFIGTESGPGVVSASALTNSIAIGYRAHTTASNQVVLGNSSITETVLRGSLTLADPANIVLGTVTGTKIGTATTQLLAFWDASPVVQPAGIADVTGGGVVDVEARAALNALFAKLESVGLLAAA